MAPSRNHPPRWGSEPIRGRSLRPRFAPGALARGLSWRAEFRAPRDREPDPPLEQSAIYPWRAPPPSRAVGECAAAAPDVGGFFLSSPTETSNR